MRRSSLRHILLVLHLLICSSFESVWRSNDVGPSTEINDFLPDLRSEDVESVQLLALLIQRLVYFLGLMPLLFELDVLVE